MEPKVNIALEAARKGCKELLRFSDSVEKLDISEKGPNDYVTQLDKRVEEIIIDSLSSFKLISCFCTFVFFRRPHVERPHPELSKRVP